MKNAARILTLSILLVSLIVLFIPAAAQQEGGGTIVLGLGTAATDAETLQFHGSNYYCDSADCWHVNRHMYIRLFGIDPEIGWFAPHQHGALVDDWEFSNGNQVVTLNLRDDLYWSDGTPITSADVMMSYELSLRPDSTIQGEHRIRALNSDIASVEAPDEHTIVVRFNQVSCQAIPNIDFYLQVLPAHIYRQLIDEVGYEELRNHEWFQNPEVTSGPFTWGGLAEDATITLYRNDAYTDTPSGYFSPERFIQVPIPPEGISPETFLSSEINVLGGINRSQRQAFKDAAEVGDLQIYEYLRDNITFVALNLADPTNPQSALDEDGNRIEQGLHPILGDKLTRQAIAHAIDVDSIIDEAFLGFGTRIPTHIVPGAWSYNNNLPFIPYEPETALAMLAEAGWVPENPILPASENNKLICQDCLYAREVDENFNGSYLEFELLTNDRNEARKAATTLIQNQLSEIGITVRLNWTDFNTLLDSTLGQTFDATLLGFDFIYPHYPVFDGLFGANIDSPFDGGLNWSSFYNEALYALEETALSVPGCGLTEQANIYHQMQEILYDEQPWIFLFANYSMYAAKNEVEGFNPYPNDLWWNVDTWLVHEND